MNKPDGAINGSAPGVGMPANAKNVRFGHRMVHISLRVLSG